MTDDQALRALAALAYDLDPWVVPGATFRDGCGGDCGRKVLARDGDVVTAQTGHFPRWPRPRFRSPHGSRVFTVDLRACYRYSSLAPFPRDRLVNPGG